MSRPAVSVAFGALVLSLGAAMPCTAALSTSPSAASATSLAPPAEHPSAAIAVRIHETDQEVTARSGREAHVEEREKENRAIQVRATIATERQADLALAAAALSLLGTVFLAWTLYETRRSARATEKAADASIASAKSAAEAIERSQRPFLVVSQVQAQGLLHHPSLGPNAVTVTVENVGEVHAFVEAFGSHWEIGPAGMPLGHCFAIGRPSIATPLIGPKSSGKFEVEEQLTAEVFDQQVAGQRALFLQGFINYRSPRGGRYTTLYCWKYGTHGPGFVPDPFNTVNWTESADHDAAAAEHKYLWKLAREAEARESESKAAGK